MPLMRQPLHAILQQEFASPALMADAHIVARSSIRDEMSPADAQLESDARREAFANGTLALARLPAEQVLAHVDAAYMPKVGYTALLYLGRGETPAGGTPAGETSAGSAGSVRWGPFLTDELPYLT